MNARQASAGHVHVQLLRKSNTYALEIRGFNKKGVPAKRSVWIPYQCYGLEPIHLRGNEYIYLISAAWIKMKRLTQIDEARVEKLKQLAGEDELPWWRNM